MRLLLLLLIVSCSQTPKKQKASTGNDQSDLVSVHVALDQAQASYLRGCVESVKDLGIAPAFPECLEKSKAHRLELNQIMDQ